MFVTVTGVYNILLVLHVVIGTVLQVSSLFNIYENVKGDAKYIDTRTVIVNMVNSFVLVHLGRTIIFKVISSALLGFSFRRPQQIVQLNICAFFVYKGYWCPAYASPSCR